MSHDTRTASQLPRMGGGVDKEGGDELVDQIHGWHSDGRVDAQLITRPCGEGTARNVGATRLDCRAGVNLGNSHSIEVQDAVQAMAAADGDGGVEAPRRWLARGAGDVLVLVLGRTAAACDWALRLECTGREEGPWKGRGADWGRLRKLSWTAAGRVRGVES